MEQASYLYEKLQINNPERWRQQPGDQEQTAAAGGAAAAVRKTATASVGPGPSSDWRSPGGTGSGSGALHTSTSISPSPIVSSPIPSTPFPDPLAPSPYAATAAGNPSPDPTAPPPGAAAAASPAAAAAAAPNSRPQTRSVTPSPLQQAAAWPALVAVDEWAGVLRIMDACRHATLYERWIRLRPFMSGAALPQAYARLAGMGQSGGAAAGEGEAEGGAGPQAPGTPAAPSPFSHGPVNGELLEYLHEVGGEGVLKRGLKGG
mgnify:CR=1 FL=1